MVFKMRFLKTHLTMKFSINNLKEYARHIGAPAKEAESVKEVENTEDNRLTREEFDILCTAARHYIKTALQYNEKKTRPQERRRIINRQNLNHALCKLRRDNPHIVETEL